MELKTRQPRYVEVRNALLEDMRRGAIHDGERIPSEAELCTRFDTSRITVRRAVEELVHEGALEKRHGVGTFARVSGFAPSLMSLGGFGAASNLRAEARRHVVNSGTAQLTEEEAEALEQSAGDEAVALYRVLLDGDSPLALDLTLYPAKRLPDFLDRFEGAGSTFKFMAEHYGLIPSASTGTLRIGYATAEEGGLLGLPANEAVIRIEKLVRDQHGSPLLLSRLALHPVRVNLSFEGNPVVI